MPHRLTDQNMTSTELRGIIEYLYGYGGQSKLARALNVNPRTVRAWAAGKYPIPGTVAVAIRQMLEIYDFKKKGA